MLYLGKEVHDGHDLCPCGSKRYIRKCHGKWLLPCLNNKIIRKVIIDDLNEWEEFLRSVKQNKEKTE